ncbi:MAG: hypothetical protein M3N32_05160 [Actinomycetota bacterium]|nr:hypothetical protein [Actinomycetota bacterium]
MSLSKSVTRMTAAAAALALFATACGSTGETDIEKAAPPPIEEATKHPTDSFASEELRKGTGETQELAHTIATAIDEHKRLDGDTASKAAEMLDGFDLTLRGHVILTSLLTHAWIAGGKHEDVEAAGHTLEENSTTLVHHLLGTHYDRKTLEDFEERWKFQVTRVVDYAQGTVAEDPAKQTQNRDELRRFAQDFGVFISRDLTHGNLDAALVTDEFTKLVESQLAIVDAQARGPDWHLNLEPGLEHATAFAETLAGGVARTAAVQGSIDTQAALLLTELTGRLADHVYFTGLVTQPILVDQHEAAASASELVKTNTDKLTEFFGSNFGEETASRFRSLWEHQVTLFEEYARKLRAQDAEGVQHAKDELATFAKHFGELVANRVEHEVEASSVEARTNLYIETLLEAVRSQSRAAGH